ncbi:MAG: TrkA C-terminal domain-containing protein [Chloroflexota bacterium]
MIPIVSLFIIIVLSALIMRVATIALAHTGLSNEVARFQTRSAFTGAGFTTTESEKVVNHPVRRKIVMLLILLGNLGFVSAISTFILTFVDTDSPQRILQRFSVLAAALLILWLIIGTKWVDQRLSVLITWMLDRYTDLDIRDYTSLMQLAGDYRIVEMEIEDDDWIAGLTLGEAKLRAEGVIVLGVNQLDADYLGVPTGNTCIEPGDVLIAYGRLSTLEALDRRRKSILSQLEHAEAVVKQREVIREAEQRQQQEAAKLTSKS